VSAKASAAQRVSFEAFAKGVLTATDVDVDGHVDQQTSLFDDLCFDSFHFLELLAFIDDLVDSPEPPDDPTNVFTLGDAYMYYVKLCDDVAGRVPGT